MRETIDSCRTIIILVSMPNSAMEEPANMDGPRSMLDHVFVRWCSGTYYDDST